MSVCVYASTTVASAYSLMNTCNNFFVWTGCADTCSPPPPTMTAVRMMPFTVDIAAVQTHGDITYFSFSPYNVLSCYQEPIRKKGGRLFEAVSIELVYSTL